MIPLDPAHTALLVMDLQSEILAMVGDKGAAVVERASHVLAAARAARLPVIHVVVGFRPGYPELSPRNPAYATIPPTGRFLAAPGADIAPAVRPLGGEPVVVKHRPNAFLGTDLEMLLRARNVDTLVLTGTSTSGVILSTVRYAAESDYRLVVAKDGCADGDDEVQRVLTEKVLTRQATVLPAADVIALLPKA